jgi:hypothetical protein
MRKAFANISKAGWVSPNVNVTPCDEGDKDVRLDLVLEPAKDQTQLQVLCVIFKTLPQTRLTGCKTATVQLDSDHRD